MGRVAQLCKAPSGTTQQFCRRRERVVSHLIARYARRRWGYLPRYTTSSLFMWGMSRASERRAGGCTEGVRQADGRQGGEQVGGRQGSGGRVVRAGRRTSDTALLSGGVARSIGAAALCRHAKGSSGLGWGGRSRPSSPCSERRGKSNTSAFEGIRWLRAMDRRAKFLEGLGIEGRHAHHRPHTSGDRAHTH